MVIAADDSQQHRMTIALPCGDDKNKIQVCIIPFWTI